MTDETTLPADTDMDAIVTVASPTKRRHRHEQSMLRIGGAVFWCWQCGAIRLVADDAKWIRATGIDGPNPTQKGMRL